MSASDPLDEFYRLIGMCIAEWANVENYLVAVCWKCLRTRVELSSIVYYGTPQLDSRLRLVGELVHATLPPKTRKDGGHEHHDVQTWEALRNDASRLLSIRRRIAHHPVTAFLETSPPPEPRLRVQIEQSFAEALRPKKSAVSSPLSQEDLSQHLIDVQSLKARLISFYENVLPKYVE